jgi:hypothetical protein
MWHCQQLVPRGSQFDTSSQSQFETSSSAWTDMGGGGFMSYHISGTIPLILCTKQTGVHGCNLKVPASHICVPCFCSCELKLFTDCLEFESLVFVILEPVVCEELDNKWSLRTAWRLWCEHWWQQPSALMTVYSWWLAQHPVVIGSFECAFRTVESDVMERQMAQLQFHGKGDIGEGFSTTTSW